MLGMVAATVLQTTLWSVHRLTSSMIEMVATVLQTTGWSVYTD